MMKIRDVLIGLIVFGVLAGVIVSCGGGGGGSSGPATYSVGGTLSGATGTVVLKLNGGSNLSMANGPFTFATMLANAATYNVQVVDASDRCTVTNGAGTMSTANVTNVAITCAAQAAQMVIRSARINGAQENPPSASTASGVGGIIVDPTTKAITGGMTFTGLTPTAGGHHIHQAPSGNPTGNGPVIIGLTLASDGGTAFVPPGTVLTDPQYAALLAGELYFNVHSTNNLCGPAGNTSCAAGEIRGQINAQGGVLASTVSLDSTQEVPAGQSTATGTGTVIVDAATGVILITYITHNVSSASAAHIHTSPTGPGSNGTVIVGFPNLQTNFDGLGTNLAYPPLQSPMTQYLTAFTSNYLYFNVHSPNLLCPPPGTPTACTGGEIRGNIAVQ